MPDHSAFSRAHNERFREGEVFRRMFERIVEICIALLVVALTAFAAATPACAQNYGERALRYGNTSSQYFDGRDDKTPCS
jgi:hypothetical protein